MRASDYGVENLKRIADNLIDWTYVEGDDYSALEELYNNVVSQWSRYTGHVVANVGGIVRTRKRQGQAGVQYEMVKADKQKRAIEYLNRQVFATPHWLLDSDILERFQATGAIDLVHARQSSGLDQVLNVERMKRLIEQEAFYGDQAYSLNEMLVDLRSGVWSELASGRETDVYRRNLQRSYLDRMATLLEHEDAVQTDIVSFARGELQVLREQLESATSSHRPTELHFRDAILRIGEALEPS